MLRELSIRNFAIIDDLKIRFSDGLTILTGETGAGKSIIISAVNLLLGSRATAQLIRSGSESAELESFFEISCGSRVARILETLGYDAEEGLVIRRVISHTDRGRIYINGRLATISLLNEITENLASISGQHAHQGLLKEENHLLTIDQFGGLMPLREEVGKYYHEILPLIQELKKLQKQHERQQEQRSLYRFQKGEIEETAIVPGEETALEQERIRLKNSETLYLTVQAGIETIYSADGAVIEQLAAVNKDIEKASLLDPGLSKTLEDMQGAVFQLEDIVENLRNYLNTLQTDERRIEAVEERLDTLNRIKRKYGGSLEAVASYLENITGSLSEIENLPIKISETEKKLADIHRQLAQSAKRLSQKRRQAADNLSKKMESELSSLRMEKTAFRISFKNTETDPRIERYLNIDGKLISDTGIDRAAFLMAPNIGEPLKPLASIASGGELSRVVLALKAILAETESVETVVFDEVDAGIGGSVADVVGKKLSDLSAYHQIICITHLPQIARFGRHHFRISKSVYKKRTRTVISPLKATERVEEIARMLGGIAITAATRAHARELLENS
jgi:DNA repair protein RecN (Recombination protein N)